MNKKTIGIIIAVALIVLGLWQAGVFADYYIEEPINDPTGQVGGTFAIGVSVVDKDGKVHDVKPGDSLRIVKGGIEITEIWYKIYVRAVNSEYAQFTSVDMDFSTFQIGRDVVTVPSGGTQTTMYSVQYVSWTTAESVPTAVPVVTSGGAFTLIGTLKCSVSDSSMNLENLPEGDYRMQFYPKTGSTIGFTPVPGGSYATVTPPATTVYVAFTVDKGTIDFQFGWDSG